MKLTAHFTLEEVTYSDTARRKGIDNSVPVTLMPNINKLAQGLEAIRTILDHPMIISSGYRCPALNKAIGGSKTSSHMNAEAADFTSPKFGTVQDICEAIIKSGIKFDQLIKEHGKNSSWVHIGFGSKMRQQVLTYKGGQYYNGLI